MSNYDDDMEKERQELLKGIPLYTEAAQPIQELPLELMSQSWAPVGPGYCTDEQSAKKSVPMPLDPKKILSILKSYSVPAQAVEGAPLVGPGVATYAIRLEEGSKVSTIQKKASDLAFGLGVSSVRVLPFMQTHIGCIGLEVPNMVRGVIPFKDVLASVGTGHPGKVPIALGVETTGRPYILDLAKLPHLLIAGKSGSGKSVAMQSVLASIAALCSPEDCQVVIVDPKQVDYHGWAGLPHLVVPPVHDPSQIKATMQYVVSEMDDRYNKFRSRGCSSLDSYNDDVGPYESIPRMVVLIDEYGDLMCRTTKSEGPQASLIRLAQMGRAAGIHLVLATQRPTSETMHSDIKNNCTRIACKVETWKDSTVILDETGAEDLMGMGDALVKGNDGLTRVQCAWVSPEDIRVIKAGTYPIFP